MATIVAVMAAWTLAIFPRHHRDLAPVMMRRALALVVIGALVAAGVSCSGHRESRAARLHSASRSGWLSSKDGVLEVRLSAHQGSVDLDTVSQPVSNFLVFGYTLIQGGSSSDGSTAGDNSCIRPDPAGRPRAAAHRALRQRPAGPEDRRFYDPAFTKAGGQVPLYPPPWHRRR